MRSVRTNTSTKNGRKKSSERSAFHVAIVERAILFDMHAQDISAFHAVNISFMEIYLFGSFWPSVDTITATYNILQFNISRRNYTAAKIVFAENGRTLLFAQICELCDSIFVFDCQRIYCCFLELIYMMETRTKKVTAKRSEYCISSKECFPGKIALHTI